MDYTNVITTMAMGMSQSKIASGVSIAMLKNTMNSDEAANAKLLESIAQAAPSADGRGALIDVRA